MKTVGYYPGCSLSGSGIELDLSIRALAAFAGTELREIDDWNCCGATAAHSLNHDLAVSLPARVLALAAEQRLSTVLAPCAACFSRLKGTQVRLKRSAALRGRMSETVGRDCAAPVKVLNINEFINHMLDDGLADKLIRPFSGVKAVPYYGCLLSRPEGIIEGEDHESPAGMARAIRAAGCEPVPWNFATECCGGGFSLSKTDAVVELGGAILSDAKDAGADAIVVGCPMCHSNLDMRQRDMNASGKGPFRVPIIYLSELLGLAAGLDPKALGLDRHFTDALSLAGRRK